MKWLESMSARQRALLILVVAGAMLVFSRPNPLAIAGGTMLVCLGTVLRNWTVGYRADPDQLGVHGPYSMTQNPVVLANVLIAFGFTLASTHPATVALGLVSIFVLARSSLRQAEAFRREHFGATFESHAKQTPVFWPSPSNLMLARGAFSWKRVFEREEWLVWIGVFGLIVVFWWIFYMQATGRWWM